MRLLIALGNLVCIVSLGVSTSWAQAPPQRRPFSPPETPRQSGRIREADITHVKAVLTLNAKAKEVSGTVTHTLTPLHPFLQTLTFDIGPRLKVSGVTVGSGGTPCTFSVKGEKLTVTLDRPYGPGATIELTIAYSGQPQSGLHFISADPAYPDRLPAIWTQGEAEDNHHWLPCYDYPNDKSTTEMIITVAKPMSVVSNGTLVDTKENTDGTRTFHWKLEQPHSTYLITVAAGDFVSFHDRVGDLPIDYYVARNVDEATARRFMGKTPQMVRFFNEKIGQPYPYLKYAQVCLPEFGGGMENTSATSMTDEALLDDIQALEGDQDGLVAHELAHQWFGDLLTCKDWSHLWLNEGFASYFDPLFAQYERGEDEFRIRMDDERRSYLDNDRGYRRPTVENRYRSPMQMFDGMTYAKGGCILHMLRAVLGEENWWKAIRLYVSRNKFQVVETDDFRKAVDEASAKDFKWFFDQWLYKAGHPELKVRWRYEADDRTVRVKVEQTQKLDDQTPVFRLPTTLELTDAAGKSSTIAIVIDGVNQEFVIPAETKPKMVRIDPDCRLVKEIDFEKPVDERIFELEHASCVICRINAARVLARQHRAEPGVQKALETCWKNEKSLSARTRMVEAIGGQEAGGRRRRPGQPQNVSEEPDDLFRSTLLEAAMNPDARVRVAAIRGLSRLKQDPQTEAVMRAAWSNPKEAYGARITAIQTLARSKVKDADELLLKALHDPIGKHRLAAVALELLAQQSNSQARELVATYARHGQPRALRLAALGAFERLAKDDPSMQEVLLVLIDDPDQEVQRSSWRMAGSLKLKKALPALEGHLASQGGTSEGFVGFGAFSPRSILERSVKEIKDSGGNASATAPHPEGRASEPLTDLEKQAEDLENRARELRKRIEAMKPAAR